MQFAICNAAGQTTQYTIQPGQTVTVTISVAPATQPSTQPSQPQTPGSGGWLGMNLEANTPWTTQAAWCDVCRQMTGWYAVDGTSPTYDGSGYPTGGHAKCHCWLYAYPSGTYHVHWDGPGPFYVSAKTIANQVVEGAGHGGDVTFNTGDYAELYAQGPVSNVHLYSPDAKAGQTYRDAFLNAVRPWHRIRFMAWCYINYAPQGPYPATTAATRVKPTDFDQTTHGVAYELMAELAREAGVTPWFNLPYGASDDYITAAAQAFAGLDEADGEYGNEDWNQGNGYQGNLIRADAQAAPAGTYGAGDINQLGARRAAALTAHAGQILRGVLGSHVKVIFGAQATWAAWAQDGLGFLKPGDVDVLAVAPYFQPVGNDPTDNVANIEASCSKWIDTVLDPNLQLNHAAAQKYGCAFWAYEGGQHLITGNPAVPSGVMLQMNAAQIAAFNADLYTQCQTDPGTGTLLDHLFAVCKKDGIERFYYFLLIGDWGKSGYWGVYRQLGDPDGVKAQACKRAG